MRAIASALISFVCFYIAKNAIPQKHKDREWIGTLFMVSLLFLFIAIVLMVLGL